MIGNGTVLPNPTVGLDGNPIDPALTTVMLEVVLGMLGVVVLAVMTVLPRLCAITATFVVVEPCGIVTVAGTVATVGSLDTMLNVSPPAGAAPERFRARFRVASPVIVADDWLKLTLAFTFTEVFAVVTPLPEAVMVADPRLTPVMDGGVAGAVWPARMVMLAGEIVTLVGSLLTRPIVRSAGAAVVKVTGNATEAAKPTVGLDGSVTVSGAVTATLAVASGMLGRLLA